jgi:hypothetical protein
MQCSFLDGYQNTPCHAPEDHYLTVIFDVKSHLYFLFRRPLAQISYMTAAILNKYFHDFSQFLQESCVSLCYVRFHVISNSSALIILLFEAIKHKLLWALLNERKTLFSIMSIFHFCFVCHERAGVACDLSTCFRNYCRHQQRNVRVMCTKRNTLSFCRFMLISCVLEKVGPEQNVSLHAACGMWNTYYKSLSARTVECARKD